MPYGLYISAEGANAQSQRLQIIANNLANVDTVGFKRELAILQARYAEEIEQGLATPGSGSINDLGGGVQLRATKTDFSQGKLKNTGVPTHFAIEGEGFFAVEKDGTEYLTRAGNFRLTDGGQLVTQQGHAVLSDAGTPIIISRPNEPWSATSSGGISQAGTVQNLAIVKPASLGDLVKSGENLFRPLADPQPVPVAERNVLDRHLEASGVQPTKEMIEMIEASRVLEANVNMVKTQDEMLSGLVNRLMRS